MDPFIGMGPSDLPRTPLVPSTDSQKEWPHPLFAPSAVAGCGPRPLRDTLFHMLQAILNARWAMVLLACTLPAEAAWAQAVGSTFDPTAAVRGPLDEAPDDADREPLEAALEQATGGLDQGHAHLALAQWWVAVKSARPATRWLVGLETTGDREAIAVAAETAAKHLKEARTLLDDEASFAGDDAKERRQTLLRSADTLEAFVEIFQQARLGNESQADRETWRKAGRGLALAREADDKAVAAAALLWQAFAFEQAGRRDRALEALPDALARPEHLPYSFMSRLVRCRMMARAGQVPAAVVLLSRIDAQLRTWMTNRNQDRNKARRLVGLVQYHIIQQWNGQMEDAASGAPLAELLAGVEKSFAEVKTPEVYHMATALPAGVIPRFEPPARTPAAVPPAESAPAEPAPAEAPTDEKADAEAVPQAAPEEEILEPPSDDSDAVETDDTQP